MNISKLHIKQAAFPNEHGSWGFVLEPLVLALLVAYSSTGSLLFVTAFFLFLSHQPMKNIIKKYKNKPLLNASLLFLIIYLLISFFSFSFVLSEIEFFPLIFFGVAIVIMVFYLFMELMGKNRNLFSELIAPISISFIAVSIYSIKTFRIEYIIAFFFVLLARSIPTTFYIHAKLLLIKKKKSKNVISIISGCSFLIILFIFAVLGYSPYLAVAASLVLLIRAYFGLYISDNKIKITTFGIWEFIYGGLFVVITAAGYILKI
ncbi:MAG TPA: hypothetical protein ENI57_08450 [Ignavibacteria bacterium]|nr:hypothetical protein [Ignavibacteria bacterium]